MLGSKHSSPGEERTEADVISTITTAVVVPVIGFLVVRSINGKVEDVNGRLDDFRQEVNRRFEAIDRRFERQEDRADHRFDVLQAAIGEIRGDVTRLAFALGAGPQTEAGGG